MFFSPLRERDQVLHPCKRTRRAVIQEWILDLHSTLHSPTVVSMDYLVFLFMMNDCLFLLTLQRLLLSNGVMSVDDAL
jgi:hypothetical protein